VWCSGGRPWVWRRRRAGISSGSQVGCSSDTARRPCTCSCFRRIRRTAERCR
jgi:hypothetical protein